MKGIEIRKALYQGNETAETLGISMRETFPVGCDACSASRPKSTHTGPKISQVMTLVERDAKGGPLHSNVAFLRGKTDEILEF